MLVTSEYVNLQIIDKLTLLQHIDPSTQHEASNYKKISRKKIENT